jgi:hypothetical protein
MDTEGAASLMDICRPRTCGRGVGERLAAGDAPMECGAEELSPPPEEEEVGKTRLSETPLGLGAGESEVELGDAGGGGTFSTRLARRLRMRDEEPLPCIPSGVLCARSKWSSGLVATATAAGMPDPGRAKAGTAPDATAEPDACGWCGWCMAMRRLGVRMCTQGVGLVAPGRSATATAAPTLNRPTPGAVAIGVGEGLRGKEGDRARPMSGGDNVAATGDTGTAEGGTGTGAPPPPAAGGKWCARRGLNAEGDGGETGATVGESRVANGAVDM